MTKAATFRQCAHSIQIFLNLRRNKWSWKIIVPRTKTSSEASHLSLEMMQLTKRCMTWVAHSTKWAIVIWSTVYTKRHRSLRKRNISGYRSNLTSSIISCTQLLSNCLSTWQSALARIDSSSTSGSRKTLYPLSELYTTFLALLTSWTIQSWAQQNLSWTLQSIAIAALSLSSPLLGTLACKCFLTESISQSSPSTTSLWLTLVPLWWG